MDPIRIGGIWRNRNRPVRDIQTRCNSGQSESGSDLGKSESRQFWAIGIGEIWAIAIGAIRDNLPLRGTLTSICVVLGALTSCAFIIWCLYWSRQPRVFRHFTWLFCIYVADLVRPSDPFSMLSLMFEKYIVQNNRWWISWNAPFSQRLGNRRLCLSEEICGPVHFRGVTIFIITWLICAGASTGNRYHFWGRVCFHGTKLFPSNESILCKQSCFREIILETMCFYVT